ncbi:hypothetical protein OG373_36515 [Streptomyces avidinii]|nr:hypothetical protein OG373_36515 [Streptomyces avidinii]
MSAFSAASKATGQPRTRAYGSAEPVRAWVNDTDRGAQPSPAIQRAARTMPATIASTCWGCMLAGSTVGRYRIRVASPPRSRETVPAWLTRGW